MLSSGRSRQPSGAPKRRAPDMSCVARTVAIPYGDMTIQGRRAVSKIMANIHSEATGPDNEAKKFQNKYNGETPVTSRVFMRETG